MELQINLEICYQNLLYWSWNIHTWFYALFREQINKMDSLFLLKEDLNKDDTIRHAIMNMGISWLYP